MPKRPIIERMEASASDMLLKAYKDAILPLPPNCRSDAFKQARAAFEEEVAKGNPIGVHNGTFRNVSNAFAKALESSDEKVKAALAAGNASELTRLTQGDKRADNEAFKQLRRTIKACAYKAQPNGSPHGTDAEQRLIVAVCDELRKTVQSVVNTFAAK